MSKLDISLTSDGVGYKSIQIFNNEDSILGFFLYLKSYCKTVFKMIVFCI